MILSWAFDHFVVFEGFTGREARINDPATGRRAISMKELDESFTGIVIDFEVTADFHKGGQRFSPVRAISGRLGRHGGGMAQAIAAGLLSTVPGVVAAGFVSFFVDDILAIGDRSFLMPLLGGVALATVLRFGTVWLQQRQLLRIQVALARSSTESFLWRVIRAPMQFYGQRYTADLTRRMSSNTSLAQVVAGLLVGLLISRITALTYALVMTLFSWQLALIVFGLAAANVGPMSLVMRRRRTLSQALAKYQADLATTTYSGLRTIETLKATSTEPFYFAKWAGEQA